MWNIKTVQHLLKKPNSLLKQQPFHDWVHAHGGIQQVYQQLLELPLGAHERQVLQLLLADPEASQTKRASQLHIHRVTLQRHQRSLFDKLVEFLNAGLLDQQTVVQPSGQHLPLPLTPLVGRIGELATVRSYLLGPPQVVQIIGTGGVGKTRLALHSASLVEQHFQKRIIFVALAAVRETHAALQMLAQQLDIRDSAQHTLLESVVLALRQRPSLLVLDNIEQINDVDSMLQSLISHIPQLKVLLTSRQRLALTNSAVLQLHPLPTPDLSQPPEMYRHSPAVELFLQRAQAANYSLLIDSATLNAVAHICVRLDGLPLALELAAARTRIFAPATLLQHLEQRLNLLTNGPQTPTTRHATLRSTIAWSYALLDAQLQSIVRCVSVLLDYWPLAAAQAVCVNVQPTADELQLALFELVDHHLLTVVPSPSDEPQFGMLETTREYMREQLVSSGELTTLLQRHARFYSDIVYFEPLHTPAPDDYVSRLKPHASNAVAALSWCSTHDPARAIDIFMHFWWYWLNTGNYRQIIAWSEQLLLLPEAHSSVVVQLELRHAQIMPRGFLGEINAVLVDTLQICAAATQHGIPLLQARMEYLLGRLYYNIGDHTATLLHLERASQLYTALELPKEVISAESLRGNLLCDRGEFAASQVIFERCLELAQSINFTYGIVRSLSCLAQNALYSGDAPTALQLSEHALALAQEHTVPIPLSTLYGERGMAALYVGDIACATQSLELAVAADRERQQLPLLIIKLADLAHIYIYQQRFAEALALLLEGLQLQQTVETYPYLAWYFDQTAYICLQTERPAAAAWCMGFSQALHTLSEFPRPRLEQQTFDAYYAQLQQQLPLTQLQHHYDSGCTASQPMALQTLHAILSELARALPA